MHGLAVLWIDGQLETAVTKDQDVEAMAEQCAELLSHGVKLRLENRQSRLAGIRASHRRVAAP